MASTSTCTGGQSLQLPCLDPSFRSTAWLQKHPNPSLAPMSVQEQPDARPMARLIRGLTAFYNKASTVT